MLKQFSSTRLVVFIIVSSCIALLAVFPSNAAKIDEFIPADTIFYATIRDLEVVWAAIDGSENWRSFFNEPSIQPQINEFNQAMQIMELLLGINPLGLVEVFGHQMTLTIFPDGSELMTGVVVNTDGAIREAERIVTGLGQLAGMAGGNRVEPYAGKYQEIEYHIAQIDQWSLTYGFVDDFLVVGFTPGSFGALIDTYKKRRASIQSHAEFRQLYDALGDGQAFAYLNVDAALPFIATNIDEITEDMKAEEVIALNAVGFDSLQTLVCSLNLLEGGDGIQLYAQIKPSRRNGILGPLLQEGQPLQSIQGMSGTEDFFIALSPASSEVILSIFETLVTTGENNPGTFYDFILAIEELLSLDVEEYIVGALTGEIALWGNFSDTPESMESLTDPVETDVAIVIGLKNRVKWNTFLDSIQSIANLSIQQYEYKGTTLHQLPLPPAAPTITARYGQIKNLFLIGFSDERLESVINNTLTEQAESAFEKRIKLLPANPIFLFQLKLDRVLLAVIASEEKSIQLSPDAVKRIRGTDVLTSLSVKGNEVWLKIGAPSEATIEVLGKVAALIAPTIIE